MYMCRCTPFRFMCVYIYTHCIYIYICTHIVYIYILTYIYTYIFAYKRIYPCGPCICHICTTNEPNKLVNGILHQIDEQRRIECLNVYGLQHALYVLIEQCIYTCTHKGLFAHAQVTVKTSMRIHVHTYI